MGSERLPALETRRKRICVGRPSTAYGIDRAEEAESGMVLSGEPLEIAERLRAYARAGIGHVIVHLDPDTVVGLEAFAPVLALLDERKPFPNRSRPGARQAEQPI